VLADLARLGAAFPLQGLGVVGDDEDGRFLLERFRGLGVDVSMLHREADVATSFTDVMNEEGSGERMFFHCRGANARFGEDHVPVDTLNCRLFHLGYVLLLDSLDEPDAECGTRAARLLRSLQAAGIRTSLDVVSEDSDRFRTVVPPSLKYADYLILNEIEVGRIVGRAVRTDEGGLDREQLVAAVEEVAAQGNARLIAVHMPEGVYLRDRAGVRLSCGSLDLPAGFIKGAVGAGDAFCAGMLYGLHEGWDPADCARLGTCCAAAGLSAEGASDGVGALDEVLALADQFPEREAPVGVE
jgi:sugar/nucleoside kinase (ribokinase family)